MSIRTQLGGAALPWNFITQTREENLEWLSAQNYIENLPERELQQEEAWGRFEQEYSSGAEEINPRILDTRSPPENEAQNEIEKLPALLLTGCVFNYRYAVN